MCAMVADRVARGRTKGEELDPGGTGGLGGAIVGPSPTLSPPWWMQGRSLTEQTGRSQEGERGWHSNMKRDERW